MRGKKTAVLVAGEGLDLHPSAQTGEKRVARGDWVLVRLGAAPEAGGLGLIYDGQRLLLTRESGNRPWLGRVVWRLG